MAFRVGDIVTVRSVDRIKGSVNGLNRRDGCFFMPQMFLYCGRNFRIVKVVKNVFDEGDAENERPEIHTVPAGGG